MIINRERDPNLSLYYIGGIILEILKKDCEMNINLLYEEVIKSVGVEFHIDFFYYSLDWLFLLSLIKINNGRVKLCESKN